MSTRTMKGNEALTIILDVGKSTNRLNDKFQKTFFTQAKECIEKIIQRKIFNNNANDVIGMILMGSDQTHNILNETLGGYDHLTEAFNMIKPNWQMLQILERDIKPSQSNEGDWMDALILAIEVIRNQSELIEYKSRKVVLLSPFVATVDETQVNTVIDAINEIGVELTVITDNVEYQYNPMKQTEEDENGEEVIFSQDPRKSLGQKNSEALVMKVVNKLNGVLCHFDDAFVQLIYFEKAYKRSMPWNCDLKLGSKITIQISAHVYIRNEQILPTWKNHWPDGSTHRELGHFIDDEPLDAEKQEQLIRGYMYGSESVPFDKSLGLAFNSGDKGFKCIGFTDTSLICDEHLTGSGVWIVIPRKGCPASQQKFIALVKGMQESNMALVARYVYRKNSKVKIMALFPRQLEGRSKSYKNVASLTMMELYFSDNHKYLSFPSLKSKKIQPTDEQYEAIDNLIDSMNLMTAIGTEPSGVEAFPAKKIIDPSIQHIYRTLAHRALHPTLPMPLPEQDILDLVNAPAKINEKSREPINIVKKLFPLENLIKPGKTLLFKKLQSITTDPNGPAPGSSDMPMQTNVESPIVSVGTITPADDFLLLLHQGERFTNLCVQIQNVIVDLILNSMSMQMEKLEKAIFAYREEAKRFGPYRYNEWIVDLKKILIERSKMDFWQNMIVHHQFGLIMDTESDGSTVQMEEAKEFYVFEVDKNGEKSGAEVELTVDDLL